MTTTISLAAAHTATSCAFFSVFDGTTDEILAAAARPAAAVRALTARGFTLGGALAALKAAAAHSTVTLPAS